jgi:crotonobetainyl-CoA:carnitine CoA-transferase CaiB-like acyl-CoA transferase
MLRTMSHVLVEDMVEYDARPPRRTADPGLHGLAARYRLYETADGWVFLAAPAEAEWSALVGALLPHVDLAADVRFADEAARAKHDDDLAELLATTFLAQPASAWEEQLLARDVGCVAVRAGSPDRQMFAEGGIGATKGWITEMAHPTFGTAPRLMPLVDFSRSTTVVRPSALCGAHTDAVLSGLGYDDDRIAALRRDGIVR